MAVSTLEPFALYADPVTLGRVNVGGNTQDGSSCKGVRPQQQHSDTFWTTEELDAFFEDIRHMEDDEDNDDCRSNASLNDSLSFDDCIFHTPPPNTRQRRLTTITTTNRMALENRMQRLEHSVCILLQNEQFLLQQQREAAQRNEACFLDIQTLMNIAEKQRCK